MKAYQADTYSAIWLGMSRMTVSTAEDRSMWLHGGGKKDFGMLTRGRSKCQRASQVQALNRSRWPRVVGITSISVWDL